MHNVFKNWDKQLTKNFKEGAMIAQHSLSENSMFSDDSLQALLEKHPAPLSMVYAMPTNQKSETTFREGDLAGKSGKAIMEAVSKGELWVQLQKLNKTHKEYRELEKKIIGEMKSNIPGFSALQVNLSLLISSPKINVSYHADIPRNALWQIRGSKRVYIYPVTEPYISQETLESIYLGETQEAIPYSPEFDDGALVTELAPGQVATWPVNGPHRIENMGELSVSLVMEYFQPNVWIRYGVMFANGISRRRFNTPLSSTSHKGPVAWAKCAFGMTFKALKLQKKLKRERYFTFEIDPSSPTGFKEIEKRLRPY